MRTNILKDRLDTKLTKFKDTKIKSINKFFALKEMINENKDDFVNSEQALLFVFKEIHELVYDKNFNKYKQPVEFILYKNDNNLMASIVSCNDPKKADITKYILNIKLGKIFYIENIQLKSDNEMKVKSSKMKIKEIIKITDEKHVLDKVILKTFNTMLSSILKSKQN